MNILQLQKILNTPVTTGSKLIFEEILNNNGDITYDQTGQFIINSPGIYVIDWWIATQSSSSNSALSFTLKSSLGLQYTSNSPIKIGIINGNTILEVDTVPTTIWLENSSNSTVYLANDVDVKSEIRIFNVYTEDCFLNSQLTNLLIQVVDKYPNADVRVLTSATGEIFGTITSLYISPTTSTVQGLYVTDMYGLGIYTVNIDDILAFELSNSTYDNTITYLNLPNTAKFSCTNNAIINFYDYFATTPPTQEFTISAGPNASAQGSVISNQYGIVVLSESAGSSPKFFVTPKLSNIFIQS